MDKTKTKSSPPSRGISENRNGLHRFEKRKGGPSRTSNGWMDGQNNKERLPQVRAPCMDGGDMVLTYKQGPQKTSTSRRNWMETSRQGEFQGSPYNKHPHKIRCRDQDTVNCKVSQKQAPWCNWTERSGHSEFPMSPM